MPDTSIKMFQDIPHVVICERQLQIYTLANWGIFIISISCSASDNCMIMNTRPRLMKWLYTIDAIVISKCIINTFNTSMWCFNCVWQPINGHTVIYFAEAKHILNKLLLLAFSKNSSLCIHHLLLCTDLHDQLQVNHEVAVGKYCALDSFKLVLSAAMSQEKKVLFSLQHFQKIAPKPVLTIAACLLHPLFTTSLLIPATSGSIAFSNAFKDLWIYTNGPPHPCKDL